MSFTSGIPPGRTGIETIEEDSCHSVILCQEYPPAGLGLRLLLQRFDVLASPSGIPPGRTGIETRSIPLPLHALLESGIPPGRTGWSGKLSLHSPSNSEITTGDRVNPSGLHAMGQYARLQHVRDDSG